MCSFLTVVFLSFIALMGCGLPLKDVTHNKKSATEAEMINISTEINSSGLSLGGSIGFTMSISGCASGYSRSQITEKEGSVALYKGDTGCTLYLERISTPSGSDYIPYGRIYWPGLKPGSLVEFKNIKDYDDKISIELVKTLSSPLQEDDQIEFLFRQTSSGDSISVGDSLSDSHDAVTYGAEPPQLELLSGSMRIDGISAGTSSFSFTLVCNTPVVMSHCAEEPLTSISYVLVGQGLSNLTTSDASDIFSGGNYTVHQVESANVFHAGNGGFIIPSVGAPTPRFERSQITLILKLDESYRYYIITVNRLIAM